MKDCFIFLTNPIATLEGKFTKADIIDFVARTKKNKHTRQLMFIIFSDIYKVEADQWEPPVEPISSEALEIDADATGEDIYGDYGYGDEEYNSANDVTVPVKPPVDLGDGEAVIAKLVSVFKATKEN